jgi:hypothetical protein
MSVTMTMTTTLTTTLTMIVPAPVMGTVSGVRGGYAGGISVGGTMWAWCPCGTCSSALPAFADAVFYVSGDFVGGGGGEGEREVGMDKVR